MAMEHAETIPTTGGARPDAEKGQGIYQVWTNSVCVAKTFTGVNLAVLALTKKVLYLVGYTNFT